MTNAYWPGQKRRCAPRNAYTLVVQRAAIFSAVAVPVVGFNIFAASQTSATIHFWSFAMTVMATLLGSAFVVWAGSVLWPTRRALERQQDRPLINVSALAQVQGPLRFGRGPGSKALDHLRVD